MRKGQFSHVFGQRAGALSVSGAASRAVCEVSPEKVSPLVLVLRTQKCSADMYRQAVKCLLRKCLRRLVLSLLPDKLGHSALGDKAGKSFIFGQKCL